MPPINNITILGGGLTGLTVAYRLSRLIPTLPSLPHTHTHTGAHRDTKITLIEKSARIGGWVNSSSAVVRVPTAGTSGVKGNGKGKEQEQEQDQEQNGETIDVHITLEAGPRSIRPKGSAGAAYMLKLIKDLSLQPSILSVPLSHPSAKNRYILSRATNRLARLPSSLLDVLGFGGGGGGVVGQQDNGIEAPAPAPGTDAREEKRLRKLIRKGIFRDLLRTRSPAPALPRTTTGPAPGPGPAGRDTTVHALVSATLGPEIANSLISAMVHGIYAADSRGVSVRSTFPVLWDAMYGGVTGGVKRSGSLVWNLLVGSFFAGKKAPQTTEQRRAAAEEAAAWRELGELDEERKKWSVYGLKGGLGVLTDRMRGKVEGSLVDVRTGCVVEDIRVDERGMVQLTIHPSSADATTAAATQQQHETSLLISTLNPSTLHSLLTPTQPLPHLLANPSTSVGLVNLVYPLPSRSIHPDGFGYLVPRAPEDDGLPPPALPGTGTTTTAAAASTPNPAGIIGVIFDSSTLPVDPTPHAAAHVTKLTVMLGGPYWRTRDDVPQSTQLLEARARAHLEGVFPVLKGVEPLLAKAWIHRDCIPTYRPGHGARLHELHQVLSGSGSGGAGGGAGASAWAGKLVLAGSGYGGVGVNDCVGAAEGIVRAFEKRWTRDPQAGGGAEEGEKVPVTGLERWKNWD